MAVACGRPHSHRRDLQPSGVGTAARPVPSTQYPVPSTQCLVPSTCRLRGRRLLHVRTAVHSTCAYMPLPHPFAFSIYHLCPSHHKHLQALTAPSNGFVLGKCARYCTVSQLQLHLFVLFSIALGPMQSGFSDTNERQTPCRGGGRVLIDVGQINGPHSSPCSPHSQWLVSLPKRLTRRSSFSLAFSLALSPDHVCFTTFYFAA